MFSLRKNCSLKEIGPDIYDFLNKYGFGGGQYLLEEEFEIVEELCHRIAYALGAVDDRWEPTVLGSGHNPFYVAFVDRISGEVVSFYDIDEKGKRKIQARLSNLFSWK